MTKTGVELAPTYIAACDIVAIGGSRFDIRFAVNEAYDRACCLGARYARDVSACAELARRVVGVQRLTADGNRRC